MPPVWDPAQEAARLSALADRLKIEKEINRLNAEQIEQLRNITAAQVTQEATQRAVIEAEVEALQVERARFQQLLDTARAATSTSAAHREHIADLEGEITISEIAIRTRRETIEGIDAVAAGYQRMVDASNRVFVERRRLLQQAEQHQSVVEAELRQAPTVERRIAKQIELNKTRVETMKRRIALATSPSARRALEIEIQNLETRSKLLREGETAAKDFGTAMGNAFRIKEAVNFTAQIDKVVNASKAGTLGLSLMAKKAMFAFGATVVNNMIGLALEIYNVEKAFMKTTGAAEEFAKGVTRTYEATRQFGVTAKEASESWAALYETYTDFTALAPITRDEMAEIGALLQEQGVSFKAYSSGIQTATKAFGLGGLEAADMMVGLTDHARALRMPVGAMVEQFASMAPELAALGSVGDKAFKDLARTFKQTGFEMQKILQLTNKFDTFESAAEMAGGLNAALGGNFVNAMDMMMETDPVRRFEMIRDAILSTGLSFENMHYYQRKFYAEQLGFGGDILKLSMLMSRNFQGLDDNINKTADDYERMAERAAALQTIQDSLQQLLVAMVPILKPLIEGLTELIPKMHEWTTENKEGVQAFIKVAGSIWLVFKALGALAAMITGTGGMVGIGAIFGGFASAGAATAAIAAGTVSLGPAIVAVLAITAALVILWKVLNRKGSFSLLDILAGSRLGDSPKLQVGLEAIGAAARRAAPDIGKISNVFKVGGAETAIKASAAGLPNTAATAERVAKSAKIVNQHHKTLIRSIENNQASIENMTTAQAGALSAHYSTMNTVLTTNNTTPTAPQGETHIHTTVQIPADKVGDFLDGKAVEATTKAIQDRAQRGLGMGRYV